ncbi:hypothetical protein ABH16_04720 [Bacillus altitudinis]|uniref:hypothetical protein n=1 Tax=Bacillus altitudinis TaxID=293387 RepID=UPI0018CFE636|nr:hypothetical protein [Bacillus altitudinis]MBG9901831.1 hypothetical protein [Bacillus altitudinis]
MAIMVVKKDLVEVDLNYFRDMIKKQQKLIELVSEIQEFYKSDDFSKGETEFKLKFPKLEFPDWLCAKQDFCVTTAGERHWNIRECNVEAELVCVSYGLKYGTPAHMSVGRCEDLFPGNS